MSIRVKNTEYDTVNDACRRLDISRNTLLSYISQGLIPSPPTARKGRTLYRYFPEEWYVQAYKKLDLVWEDRKSASRRSQTSDAG